LWSLDSGDVEAAQDFSELQDGSLEIVVLGFGGRKAGKISGVRRISGRKIDAILALAERRRPDIAFLPFGILEHRYFAVAPIVCRLAELGTLLIAAPCLEPWAAVPDASMDSTESALTGLGCQTAAPQIEDHQIVCAQGVTEASQSAKRQDLALQRYSHVRAVLASKSFDFRPSHPGPEAVDRPHAVALGARLASSATGTDRCLAAIAGAVCAAVVAVTELPSNSSANQRIQTVVAWGLRVARDGDAEEAQAAAVAALLGLMEGFLAWDCQRPLQLHGAEVAGVVGTTLASEGLWGNFSEEIRFRKIVDLTRAGGLQRPGECTIALCQALLGVNRPEGASRLQGAVNVLRRVASLLFVQAQLPNLVPPHTAQCGAFCAVVLENLNWVRVKARINDVV